MAFFTDQKLKYTVDANVNPAQRELNKLTGDVNKLGGSFSSQFGGMIPLAGAAAAGIAAIGVAAVRVGSALFDLTRTAAEYGTKIYDAGTKTGLTAKTLSALDYAAKQTGQDFNAVVDTVAKFNVVLGSAATGNEKARATLAKYNITATDTTEAVTQAFKAIGGMRNATLQAAAAKDLFKDRTGEVLKIVNQFKGDLPGLISRLEKMGVTMSDDNAKAAKEFTDTLTDLQVQADSAGREFAHGMTPKITTALKDISKHLEANKGEWERWGRGVGDVVGGVYTILGGLVQWARDNPVVIQTIIKGNAVTGWGWYAAQEISNIGKGGSLLRSAPTTAKNAANDPRNPFYVPPVGQGAAAAGVGSSDADDDDESRVEKAKQAAEKRQREREAARKREIAAQRDHIQQLLKIENEYYETDNKFFEDQFIQKELNAEQWRVVAETNAEIYAARAKKLLVDQFKIDAAGKTSLEIENLRLAKESANRAIDNDVVRMREDREKTITGITEKADRERISNAEKAAEDLIALTRAKAETELATLDHQLQLGILKETEYAKQVGEIHLRTLEQERATEQEKNRQAVLDEAIKTQKIRNAMMVTDAIDKETKALDAQNKARQKQLKLLADIARAAVRNAARNVRKETGPNAIDELAKSWENLRKQMEAVVGMDNVLGGIGQMGIDVAVNMASAVGQAIEAWALYGDSIGLALRKALAAELAHIAGVATVNALYATALGFLRLAQWDLAGAANAFTSAALWAALAGATALAAKAINPKDQKERDQGNTRGASASGSGSEDDLRPYSRASETAYYSGTGKGVFAKLEILLERLGDQITSASPGDVFIRGANANRGFIGNQAVSDVKSNSGTGRALASAIGIK